MSDPSDCRKPPRVSWESFVERRIREAQESGMFDRLPGAGRPIPGIDEPLDENWWIKRKLRDEGVNLLPPLLEARLDIERTLESISVLTSEAEVRQQLVELNQRVREAQQSPASGPQLSVQPVDVEQTLNAWRMSHDTSTAADC